MPTMTEQGRLNELTSSRLTRNSFLIPLIVSGAILGSFTSLVFGMHHAFSSDGWPSNVDHALDFYEKEWVLALIIACVLIVSICLFRRKEGSSNNNNNLILWIALVIAGITNLASAWWYLYLTNQNSISMASPRAWILASLSCILWIAAAVVHCSKRLKTDEEDHEQLERRNSGSRSVSDLESLSLSKQPLIIRV